MLHMVIIGLTLVDFSFMNPKLNPYVARQTLISIIISSIFLVTSTVPVATSGVAIT